MAQPIAERRDIDFVLYEQLGIEKFCEFDRYSDFNKRAFDMVVSEARKFAIKEILPTFAEGDRQGVRFENGTVKVPDCFHKPFKLFVENGWTAMSSSPDLGGQGLPMVLAQAASEYLSGANYAFALYGFEGESAGKMIEHFGTDKQKQMFLEKMYTGQWGGTMDLTEPSAGSDVGALTTTAKKNDDGTYSITGNKIFITSGEQDLTENIIHPVLARIEGAPAGTRGISLFIVPKYWVDEDGSMGEFNDIVCTGTEEKMGIHASATCSLAFGGKNKCRGLLLGSENQGMKVMFQMMNEARIMVGGIGLQCASAAYMHAINYAKERIQGRDLGDAMNPDAASVAIINHPDVRRMLLQMKAYVEGMRSLLYYGSYCVDMEENLEDAGEREYYSDLLDFLTPIIKAYCTDRGVDVCSQAVQVFGGYGYTQDFPVEQLLRDVRIAPIYEGTNGIQAIDFLGRKAGMKKGKVFMNLLSEIQRVISMAKEINGLEDLSVRMEKAIEKFSLLAMHMGQTAKSENYRTAFAHATPFLDVAGDVVCAWMLLWRAVVAARAIEKIAGDAKGDARELKIARHKSGAYYEGQIQNAEYFMKSVIPVTAGRMDSIFENGSAVVDIKEASFGG